MYEGIKDVPSLPKVHSSKTEWADSHCCTWCQQPVDSQRALQFWSCNIRHDEGKYVDVLVRYFCRLEKQRSECCLV